MLRSQGRERRSPAQSRLRFFSAAARPRTCSYCPCGMCGTGTARPRRPARGTRAGRAGGRRQVSARWELEAIRVMTTRRLCACNRRRGLRVALYSLRGPTCGGAGLDSEDRAPQRGARRRLPGAGPGRDLLRPVERRRREVGGGGRCARALSAGSATANEGRGRVGFCGRARPVRT